MSLLRRLLPLGAGSCASEARSTELLRWLESLPGLDAADCARLIAARIAEIRRSEVDPWARLKLLDSLREAAEQRLPALERMMEGAALPLAEGPMRAWKGAEGLLDALAGGYAEVAVALASRWSLRSGSRPIRPPLIQAMRHCARRLALGYRIYACGTETSWLDLHRLYGLAREAGFAAALLGGDETPEAIYLKALLLSFAEPSRFAAGELDLVQAYLDRYAHLAEIVPAKPASGIDADPACFLVQIAQPRAGRSLRKWKPERIAPGDLAIRCGALLARLDGQIAGLEQHLAPPMLGLPKLAADPRYLGLLRCLRESWDAPPARRHKRMRAFPRAELTAGFDAVWQRRSAAAGADASALEGIEASEWAIRNESPLGYALGYLQGDTRRIRVGELVAMRSSHPAEGSLCVVRRLVNRWQDGLEAGVQVLGARAVAATVSVRGAGPQPQERRERILVLPAMPAHGDASGILAPIGALATGTRFSAVSRGEPTVLRVGRRIESLASCELFTLEQVAI
ncbi:MAG: hypothetical protein Fur0039_26410 [Rhodocyclaceae bacterium]